MIKLSYIWTVIAWMDNDLYLSEQMMVFSYGHVIFFFSIRSIAEIIIGEWRCWKPPNNNDRDEMSWKTSVHNDFALNF